MSKGNAVNRDEELNEVYRKTLKYVMRFNTMSNPEKQNQEVVDELDNLQEYVRPRMLLHGYRLLTLCGGMVKVVRAHLVEFVGTILNLSPSHTHTLGLFVVLFLS
jgi:DNA-directed RNA polymerase subunit F